MKTVFKIFVIFLLVLFVLILTKDTILKVGIEQGARIATGLKLNIERFHLSFLKSRLQISELTLYNPKGFEERIMVELPELTVDVNLANIIFKKIIHVEEFALHLETFNIVKNRDGEVNLHAFRKEAPAKEKVPEPKKEEKPKKEKGEPMPLQIDSLTLKIGTIAMIDYSGNAEEPATSSFVFNLDEHYEDVTNVNILIPILAQKALTSGLINGISSFDLPGVQDFLMGSLGNIGGLAGDGLKAAADQAAKIKDLGAQTDALAEGTGNALKKTGETLKGLTSKLKVPSFGKDAE